MRDVARDSGGFPITQEQYDRLLQSIEKFSRLSVFVDELADCVHLAKLGDFAPLDRMIEATKEYRFLTASRRL